jgi:competence protein ComEA
VEQVLALFVALVASVSIAVAPVNVNTATEAELQSIKGLGPTKAKAIVDYRARNGPFKSLEELEKVPGFGEGTLAKIRKDVTVSGKTAVPAGAKGAEKRSAAGANARQSAEDGSRSNAAQTTSSVR